MDIMAEATENQGTGFYLFAGAKRGLLSVRLVSNNLLAVLLCLLFARCLAELGKLLTC